MSEYQYPKLGGISIAIAEKVRIRIFEDFMDHFKVTEKCKVLDVGATSDISPQSNFFSKMYPYPQKLTTIGLENASFLEAINPGLTFKIADAKSLDFRTQEFDFAFCSAVIEHVGNKEEQAKLLNELCRVAKVVVITTPNKFFPVEFHTLTFFIHWLKPSLFRNYLRALGEEFYSKECNLNLLGHKELAEIVTSSGKSFSTKHKRLFGMTSNLVFYISDMPMVERKA